MTMHTAPITFSGQKKWGRLPRMIALSTLLGAAGAGTLTSCVPIKQISNGMVTEDTFTRAPATYHDPVDPADYNADNIQHVEFVSSQIDKELALAELRAEFNRTRNLDLLNPYLHYRRALSEQLDQDSTGETAARLRAHDRQIHRFAANPMVEFWMVGNNERLYPMDTSTRYLIAARLLELMHNRPDMLQRNVEQDPPLRFIMHEELWQTRWSPILEFDQEPLGGYWSFGNADIHLDKTSFWSGMLNRQDGYAVDLHEFAHGLDSRKFIFGTNIAHQGLRGMPDRDIKIIRKEQKRLKQVMREEIREYEQSRGGAAEAHPAAQEDRPNQNRRVRASNYKGANNISPYAFSNSWEFLPVVVETFYEKPQVLKDVSEPMYDVMVRYFRFDPLDGYRDLADASQ